MSGGEGLDSVGFEFARTGWLGTGRVWEGYAARGTCRWRAIRCYGLRPQSSTLNFK